MADPLVKKTVRKKSHNAKKTERDFSTSILSQNIKNLNGGPFGEILFPKKSLTMPKKIERGHFNLSRYGMLRGKRGKTFLVQFARPKDSICYHKKL